MFPNRHSLNKVNTNVSKPKHFSLSPGQALVLQLRSRTASPTQSRPPLEGGGLLHSRCLVRVPPPQVREHVDQLLKRPHCPSTKNI